MVALDFTDEIVYKNTYSVYIFIGLLTPGAPSEFSGDQVPLLPDRCLRQPRVCGLAILSEGDFCRVVAIIATEPKTDFPVIPSHETSSAR
jgi:hypothetical protein